MVIRCERCSTLYELDEALLAPEGSAVQCTRCDHVFTARPPTPGDRVEERPAAIDTAAAAAERASAPCADEPLASPVDAPALAPERTTPEPRPESVGPRAPAHEPRHARGATPSVYRPAPGPGSVRTHPVLRRDTVSAFESRLRNTARLRRLAPAVALGALVLAAGGWFLLRGRVDPDAATARSEGLALVALDDAASLDRAIARFDDALGRVPRLRAATADRALAQVMQATALEARSQGLAATRGARQVERERLAREQPPGWEEAARASAGEAAALEAEARALEDRARSLVVAAREALRPFEEQVEDEPALLRALAMLHVAAGDRDAALALTRAAGSPGERDPWVELADAALDAAEPQGAARERAVAKLAAIATRSPELLRARYLLARTQAALGRVEEASVNVDRLLAANPSHEDGRALRDALSRQPPATQASVPSVENPGSPVRKTVTQGTSTQSAPPAAQGGAHVPSAPAPGPAAARPATAPIDTPGAPAPTGGAAATALTPAAIPDVAPASAMPQIAPLGVSEGAGHRSREPAALEDPIGGG